MKKNIFAIILAVVVFAVFGSVCAQDTFTVGLECNYAPLDRKSVV